MAGFVDAPADELDCDSCQIELEPHLVDPCFVVMILL